MAEPTVQQQMDLTGKVALLTGASGWLGGAFAQALAEAGARVITSSRDPQRAKAAAAVLPSPGGARHFGVTLDHMEEDSLDAGFQEALQTAGQLDILVNNGHDRSSSDWTDVGAAEFSRQMRNATGYFLLARHFRQAAVDRSAGGSIIMIGSMYGVVGSYPEAYKDVSPASPVAYHALKGGIVHMTRHLAVYWAGDGVRVNCLSPGPFPTDAVNKEMVRRLEARSPMGRMGRPWELKGALLLLASEAGSYITGQNLLVDGGWTAW